MSAPADWGPSHQTGRRRKRSPLGTLVAVIVVALWVGVAWYLVAAFAAVGLVGLAGWVGWHRIRPELLGAVAASEADPLVPVRKLAAGYGAGVYLGVGDDGHWRHARPERAVLLLGPPRSGKTSAVIIPALIGHPGPAVCTSTKPDVAAATRAVRSRDGRLWVFDPTGAGVPAGFAPLRWSPVTGARSWEQALLTARAMTQTVGQGTTHASHWATRAQALLAPLLHAAAVDGLDMAAVVDWVMCHQLDQAGMILESEDASRLAFSSLVGIFNTEPRERASIFSAASDALVAYNSDAAIDAATTPNFDAAAFVTSTDTIY
ncbi:MAG: type IV secretory system conjugative DNA transfer family protein, partial [Trebonia sp.]